MKLRIVSLVAILALGTAAVALGTAAVALGTAAAAPASGWNWRVPERAKPNLIAARRDAQSLLAKTNLPSGAVIVAGDPSTGGALAKVASYPATPALVDQHRFWRVPESANAVITWLQSHAPSGSTSDGGLGSGCCTPALDATSDEFEFPAVAGVLASRGLLVTVATAPGGDAAVRADAQDVYWVPKPKSERVPAGVHLIYVTVQRMNPISTSDLTVTNRVNVRKVVKLVDALPPAQPWASHCPADGGPEVTLHFLANNDKTVPLATVVADGSGCGGVSFRRYGTQDPGLSGGWTLDAQLEKLLGFKG